MTAMSLRHPHRGRLNRTDITAAINVGRTSDGGAYSVGPAHLCEQLEVGNLTSRSQGFAGGFVDFLLGRGARHLR
jgi:hypothetical protein